MLWNVFLYSLKSAAISSIFHFLKAGYNTYCKIITKVIIIFTRIFWAHFRNSFCKEGFESKQVVLTFVARRLIKNKHINSVDHPLIAELSYSKEGKMLRFKPTLPRIYNYVADAWKQEILGLILASLSIRCWKCCIFLKLVRNGLVLPYITLHVNTAHYIIAFPTIIIISPSFLHVMLQKTNRLWFQLKIVKKTGKIVNDLVDIDFEQTVMK